MSATTKIDLDAIYTVSEAAALIRRGTTFIYELCSEKKLAHHKPSKRTILIKGKDLQEWLDGSYVKSGDTASCGPEEKDTSHSGTPTPKEKLAADATRSALTTLNP